MSKCHLITYLVMGINQAKTPAGVETRLSPLELGVSKPEGEAWSQTQDGTYIYHSYFVEIFVGPEGVEINGTKVPTNEILSLITVNGIVDLTHYRDDPIDAIDQRAQELKTKYAGLSLVVNNTVQ